MTFLDFFSELAGTAVITFAEVAGNRRADNVQIRNLFQKFECRGALSCDHAIVVGHRWSVGAGRPGVVHHDHVADGLERLQEREQQRSERSVAEDDLVLRVVRDVRNLLGEKADIERVQHAAGAGRREAELEMTRRVPPERGDSPVGGNAQCVEHSTKRSCALRPV